MLSEINSDSILQIEDLHRIRKFVINDNSLKLNETNIKKILSNPNLHLCFSIYELYTLVKNSIPDHRRHDNLLRQILELSEERVFDKTTKRQTKESVIQQFVSYQTQLRAERKERLELQKKEIESKIQNDKDELKKKKDEFEQAKTYTKKQARDQWNGQGKLDDFLTTMNAPYETLSANIRTLNLRIDTSITELTTINENLGELEEITILPGDAEKLEFLQLDQAPAVITLFSKTEQGELCLRESEIAIMGVAEKLKQEMAKYKDEKQRETTERGDKLATKLNELKALKDQLSILTKEIEEKQQKHIDNNSLLIIAVGSLFPFLTMTVMLFNSLDDNTEKANSYSHVLDNSEELLTIKSIIIFACVLLFASLGLAIEDKLSISRLIKKQSNLEENIKYLKSAIRDLRTDRTASLSM